MRLMQGAALGALAMAWATSPAVAHEATTGSPDDGSATNETAAGEDPTAQDANVIVVSGFRLLDTPLQDEAVASTSLDEDIFRYSGSTDRIDVLRTVPGVTVLNLGGRSTIVIRGTGTAPDGDPNGAAAASYIGDVPLSGLGGSRENVDLSNYDIERIDVLRGPQGFNYGGGAMSGVVRTMPNPADTSETSGRISAAARVVDHGDEPGYEIDGYVNVPLVRDLVGFRLTGYANREENPIYSVRDERQGGPAKVAGGRASLRFEPTADLTIDLRYLFERRQLMDLTRSAPTLGDYVTSEPREPSVKKTHLVWGNASWDLGFANATYVGSYLRSDEDGNYPSFWTLGTLSNGPLGYDYAFDTRNVTQELRITNDDRRGFDWTLGAYYERRKSTHDGSYVELETDTAASTEFDFDGVDDPALDNFTGGIRKVGEKQKSLFGEIAYWFGDELGVTVGARYIDHSATFGYIDTIDGVPEEQPDGAPSIPGGSRWWKKVNLTWIPTDDQLYYAQFAQVERPGGTNYAALDASCPAEYADIVQEFYPGDEMTTWEAGAKLGFGGATVNASAYYSKWKNAPTFAGALCGNGINYYIDNAASIELYGIELDAQVRISRTLSASMSAAYGVAEIAEVGPNFTGGLVGDRMPGNPDWKVSGSLDYSDTLTGDWDLFGGAGFSYTGHYLNGLSSDWSTFADFVLFPTLDVYPIGTLPGGATQYHDPGSGDYVLFDARIGVRNGDWTATLFADNLLGSRKRVIVNYLNTTEVGEATFTRVTPRTIGLRVERRF